MITGITANLGRTTTKRASRITFLTTGTSAVWALAFMVFLYLIYGGYDLEFGGKEALKFWDLLLRSTLAAFLWLIAIVILSCLLGYLLTFWAKYTLYDRLLTGIFGLTVSACIGLFYYSSSFTDPRLWAGLLILLFPVGSCLTTYMLLRNERSDLAVSARASEA